MERNQIEAMTLAQEALRNEIDELADSKGLWTEDVGPIRDGVADIEAYQQSSPKVMWVLKEPYDDFKEDGSPYGGDYTLMEDLKKNRNAQLGTMPLTIQRVIYTTYGIFTDYEYIIIDGDSTDGTLDIIKRYINIFESKGIQYSYISEADSGIYNAMTKSLKIASGEWILFMNAGDSFFDSHVLENVFSQDYVDYDFVYGDVVLYENNKYKKAFIGSIEDINDQSSICHQGAMTRTETLKEYGFDEKYRFAADYDYMIRLHKDDKAFKKINYMIAVFSLGGSSTKHSIQYLE